MDIRVKTEKKLILEVSQLEATFIMNALIEFKVGLDKEADAYVIESVTAMHTNISTVMQTL